MNEFTKISQRVWMIAAFVAFAVLGVSRAHAQLAAYGAFSTTSGLVNVPRINGGTYGVYYDSKAWPIVHLGADVRVSHVKDTYDLLPGVPVEASLTSVLAGPRVSAHVPLIPLRAYAEGLVGRGNFHDGRPSFLSRSGSGLEGAFAVGADLTIFPHLDWRVVDYTQGHIYGNADTGVKTISTGLVVRLF